MIEVYLYGQLRLHAADPRPDRESVVRLELQRGETVMTALERVGILTSDVCHVFLNGALISTHNSMAPWLEYPQAASGRLGAGSGLEMALQDGDRLGLFARDMMMLVV